MASLVENSDEFIFRSLSFFKSRNIYKLCKKNVPLSYTRVRELFKNSLQELGLNSTLFGMHSLRSGGVSAAANSGINERLIKAHGRWASDRSKDGYIKDNTQSQLSVSLNLGI